MEQVEPKKTKKPWIIQKLAELYMTPWFKEYIHNERIKEIWKLKFIDKDTIEAETLETKKQKGRIAYIEDFIQTLKLAYKEYEELQTRFKKKNLTT